MKLLVADLFCGAGGTSTGVEKAVKALGYEIELVAVNHWPLAIETHRLNHPTARHYIEDVTTVKPESIVPEGRLDLLVASPECTHFSRARGGKPVNDQSRMNPWAVHRWLTSLDIRCLLVENVPEFVKWGPTIDGKPDPAGEGRYFQSWINAMWGLGYQVEWRTLNAADFGDATTRVRFFLQARKDGLPIKWPEASHSPTGEGDLFSHRRKWRSAREIIDWSNLGRSLLDDPKYKRRPLSPKTLGRIAKGLERFGGPFAPYYIKLLGLSPDNEPDGQAQPFTFANRNENAPKSVDAPVPVITTSGGVMMVAPIVEPFTGANRNHVIPRGIDEPCHTVTASNGGGNLFLVEPLAKPFVLGQQSASAPRDDSQPIPTISTGGAISLVEPVVAAYYGNSDFASSVDEPLHTVTAKARFGIADPVVVPYRGEKEGQEARAHNVDAPLPAVTTEPAFAMATPVVIQVAQSSDMSGRARSTEEPLYTLTTRRGLGLVEPTTKEIVGDVDPNRLVVIDGKPYVLDIRFRMLNNRELAKAMGFDDAETTYEFVGTSAEVTRQIGNAVPVNLATALVTSVIST